MRMLALKALRTLMPLAPPHPSLAHRVLIRAASKIADGWAREVDVRLATNDVMTVRLDEFVGFHLFMEGGYEQEGIDFLCAQLRPGDVCFDIGAHMGLYTMFLARAVGPTGRVHAFEPGPVQRRLLERNARRVGAGVVIVQPVAVGAKLGTATFVQSDDSNLGQSHVEPGAVTGGSPVQVITLDEYRQAQRIERVHAIKIDVEGGELGVLRGATGLLAESPPRVIKFECTLDDNGTGDARPGAIFEFLRGYGYRFVAFAGRKIVPVADHDARFGDYAALSGA